MFISQMILLSSTASIVTNATLLSMSTTEQIVFSSYDVSVFKRMTILLGSIGTVWLIMGLIFVSIQTYRRMKNRTHQKFSRYNRSIVPSLPIDPISEDDDQSSVFTSVSFLSERSKITHEHTHFVPPCERILEEEFELTLPTSPGITNMAYSQSTLTSTNDSNPAILYYPACRNFAYSQSTLASSTDLNTPTPSIITAPNTDLINLQRHSSQSSSITTGSQRTNATYLSSSTSVKKPPPLLLPTLMITDCDRLQTDIIELDDFEPEKDWRRHARPELRFLLNERMPQVVR